MVIKEVPFILAKKKNNCAKCDDLVVREIRQKYYKLLDGNTLSVSKEASYIHPKAI